MAVHTADHFPDRRGFQLYAALLDYPRAGLGAAAEECAAAVAERSGAAAAALREFADFARRTPPARLEEIYTGVFELDASRHPYVGYHLFGESYKRSAFLLGLKERYRPYGIECGAELPDHVAAVLRFLAVNRDPDEARELIEEALAPALEKMLKDASGESPDPSAPAPPAPGREYRGVLDSLRLWLHTLVSDGEVELAAASGE